MKKILVFLMALGMIFSVSALAQEETSPTVYVSITNEKGELVLAHEPFALTDVDGDQALTIHDALMIAHAQKHEKGAEAYLSSKTEYGLSMNLLWGIDNGGSYGYYLNHASAWSLLDPVKDGDHVKAFVYTDLVSWSDTYCYFDADTVETAAGSEVSLTLLAAGFDAAYNPITLAVEGAVITLNGEATDVKTDADGKAAISIDQPGVYVISASSETQTLVSPVCIITVTEAK